MNVIVHNSSLKSVASRESAIDVSPVPNVKSALVVDSNQQFLNDVARDVG